MNTQSMQDITAAFDALLVSKPPAGKSRRRRAPVFQGVTGCIMQPTVADYMAGRIDIVALV